MPLNQGQQYENAVVQILQNKNKYAYVALNGNDAAFKHKGTSYYVEIKNKKAPDYGQKRLIWDSVNKWQWSITDDLTAIYDKYNLIGTQINPNFIPRRYSKPESQITPQDKAYDQQNFKKNNIPAATSLLYEFYKRRNCYYIQIEGKGFYYLEQDIANLGVPQYTPTVSVRLRAKTHSSTPAYNYSFFAVLNANKKTVADSKYDIEELGGRSFPPF